MLSGRVIQPPAPPPGNGQLSYDEDMGYRTMTREDAAMIQQQQINTTGTIPVAPHTPTSQQPSNPNIPQSPPTPQGHHRTSRYVEGANFRLVLKKSFELNCCLEI